jgi:hypothetical protein
MAYTINLTNGTIFATIADGTINTDSSMTLVGKNYAGYGQFLDDNFIHLLENGANSTPPTAPLTGQLWYDTSTSLLKVYNGSSFKVLSAATSQASAPTGSVTGDLWFDTVNQQLKIYNGTSYILVGPSYTSGTGTSGAIVDTVTDTSPGADHVIVKMYVNNQVVSIFSNSATFTPAVAISGFATINPGLNMSTTVASGEAMFVGTATSAETFGGFTASQFMRSDVNTSTVGNLSVLNDNGLYVGVNQDVNVYVNGNDGYIYNQTENGNVYIRVNDGGTPTNAITVVGSTSNVVVNSNLSVNGAISSVSGALNIAGNAQVGNISVVGAVTCGTLNAGNITYSGGANFGTSTVSLGNIINNNANGVGNIGSSTGYFNKIFATATTALYADVAERFAADETYTPGTIVEIGGAAEITRAIDELSENVFGVVSTRPAFTMNGGAGDDLTHPAIAMTGRVPVLCTGIVRKGDRLVCAGWGIARSAAKEELTPFNVIGRALTDKLTDGEGTVEAIVSIKN